MIFVGFYFIIVVDLPDVYANIFRWDINLHLYCVSCKLEFLYLDNKDQQTHGITVNNMFEDMISLCIRKLFDILQYTISDLKKKM